MLRRCLLSYKGTLQRKQCQAPSIAKCSPSFALWPSRAISLVWQCYC